MPAARSPWPRGRYEMDSFRPETQDAHPDEVRPNGRPSACDQCRSRKVACDHQRPVCGRCRKRRQADACTYSATVPRSYRTPPRSVKSASASASTPGDHRTRASAATTTTTTTKGVNRGLTGRCGASTASRTPPVGRTPATTTPVYTAVASLNASRHMAKSYVLEESRNSLMLLRNSQRAYAAEAPETMSRACQVVPYESLPSIVRESCISVLESLPGQANAQLKFRPKTHTASAWLYTAIERIIIHVTAMMERLRQEHGDRMLDAMATELCYNTTRSFKAECPDADTWLEQFSGPRLRWESIALLWVHTEYYVVYELPIEERQVTWAEGKKSPETARTYLGYCIQIARHFTEGNELLLELCLRKAKVDSILDGDSSMSAWESHGMAVTMMTFLGFHKKPVAVKKPTLCSEYKARLAAQVFTGDKLEVIFTGLPPLLSRRYYSAPPPLGLSEEDVSADQATLEAAIARLDPEGWPTNGEVNRSVMVRARLMMALLRDEIIELAFSDSAYFTVEQLLDLKQRQLGLVHRLPNGLCYVKGDIMHSGQPPHTIFARILLHLEHLQNLFFIERLQVKQNASEDGALLLISCTMTATVLEFWVNKSRLSELYDEQDFLWLVLAFGALASGIMCQELLRPTFHGAHPKDSSVSRSSIIQQLSVFVTFLDWVYPSCQSSDADLCKQCRDAVQRVLDHVLNGGNDMDLPEDMDWSFLEQVGLNNDFTSMVDYMPLNFLHQM